MHSVPSHQPSAANNHSSSDLMSLKVTGDQQIDPKKLSFMTWDVYDVWRLCMSHKYTCTWDKSVVCVFFIMYIVR